MAAAAIGVASSATFKLVPLSPARLSHSSNLSNLRFFVAPASDASFAIAWKRTTRNVARVSVSASASASLGLTEPNPLQPLKISLAAKDIDLAKWAGDILAVGVTVKDSEKDDNSDFKNPILQELDQLLGGLLRQVTSEEDFTGKVGQTVVVKTLGLAKRIVLIGLGPAVLGPADYQSLGKSVAAAAKSAQAQSAGIALASLETIPAELGPARAASAIALGAILGTFEDNHYKLEWKDPTLASVDIIGLGTGPEMDDSLAYADSLSSGVMFGQQLVNAPPNVLTPGELAAQAKSLEKEGSFIKATILNAEECAALGMGAYLGVTAASELPPHFIHLTFDRPSRETKVHLALVGKGLTFDSGGYNLKLSGSGIENMKNDMGGAAAILGAAKAISELQPSGVVVHFIIASCENMISGKGMRPGDIVTASNGKRIEVNNTDAEGRLTLADALDYACKLGVEKIVDLATLTGACITALGPSVAGVFSPSDAAAGAVMSAAEASGEKVWRLPMEESYWESMTSGTVADMLNTGPSQGGAITAALFLKQFVNEKVEWAHIDIAGPVWDEKKRTGTGFGVTTMVEWILWRGVDRRRRPN
ncbi:leucine aminopeptidase 1-like [Andrographis paniculata]|uniref:leucine aminopeptidase 1-like n=1 Tax=Andrographis paniculata TaxID=175694 RepID=UPI0021E98DC4|nr:leucine aminopeptidase 1-like [Andrographis paniculata]